MCKPYEVIFQAKKITMATKTLQKKVEILNPNTGRRMNIDQTTYDLFSKAIYHTLKAGKLLTFTQIVEGVYNCFREQKIKFEGSVEWYTISVKHDMHAKGIIEVSTEKGKKLHSLKR